MRSIFYFPFFQYLSFYPKEDNFFIIEILIKEPENRVPLHYLEWNTIFIPAFFLIFIRNRFELVTHDKKNLMKVFFKKFIGSLSMYVISFRYPVRPDNVLVMRISSFQVSQPRQCRYRILNTFHDQ